MKQVVSVAALVAIVAAIPLVRMYKAAHAPAAESRDVDEGTPADRAAKRAAIAADDPAPPPPKVLANGAKVGGFEATFAEASPFAEPLALAGRLRLDAVPTAPDLAKSPFLVFVPESYDPKRPLGLIVLCNYKASTGLPVPILPQLAQANVAFVVAKDLPDAWPHRAALALDAVHNMGRLYKIDPRRTYIFSSNDPDGATATATDPAFTGLRVGLNFPDVFAGTFASEFGNYRPVRAANGGSWPARLPGVNLATFALARKRPLVLSTGRQDDYHDRLAASYTADGFKHVLSRVVTRDQTHYPNYTTDWVPEVLKFLDDAGKESLMTDAAATQPTP